MHSFLIARTGNPEPEPTRTDPTNTSAVDAINQRQGD